MPLPSPAEGFSFSLPVRVENAEKLAGLSRFRKAILKIFSCSLEKFPVLRYNEREEIPL